MAAEEMSVKSAATQPVGVPVGEGPVGPAAAPPVQRVRVTFVKGPEIRFIGHLDVARLWERAARRARLPLAYTLGFTPHPRFAFASPLALGTTGERELLDVHFTQEVPLDELRTRLCAQMPRGCSIVDLQRVPLDEPALMARVRWAEYRIDADESLSASAPGGDETLTGKDTSTGTQGSRWSRGATGDVPRLPTDEELAALVATNSPWRPPTQQLAPLPPQQPLPSRAEVQRRIASFLAAEHVPWSREREGKRGEHDVRPAVLDLWILPTSSQTGVRRFQHAVPPRGRSAGAGFPARRGARERHRSERAGWSEGWDCPPPSGGSSTSAALETPAQSLVPTDNAGPTTSDAGLTLGMLLRAGSSGAGRPEEVAAALGLRARRVHRVRLGLEGEPPVPSDESRGE